MKTFICCLIFNLVLTISARPKEVSDDLLAVAVIFRHGHRTIADTYPNDPYSNESYWPEGLAQLTNIGKNQLFELGKWLRKEYDGFLPELYSNKDIYIRSTDVDRAIMSAQTALAGLYPPKGIQVWNKDLLWQPIPIHTVPVKDDNDLLASKNCPKYNKLFQEFLNSDFIKNLLKENQAVLDTASKHSGKEISTLKHLKVLEKNLKIERELNLTLPNWASDEKFLEKLKSLAGVHNGVAAYNKDLARLTTGIFWNKLIKQFKKKISGEDAQKFLLFSAHDSVLARLLQSLEVFDFLPAPYAASLIVELRGSQSKYVRILYKKLDELQKLSLKECGADYCSFDKFVDVLKPIAVSEQDWEKECNDVQ